MGQVNIIMLNYPSVKGMSGEIIKTKGTVLRIRPWSRTSHVVTWLTPDHGPVATLVKGAVRPKSFTLGQYDLFYTCELLYYARTSNGELHALREVHPSEIREHLRGDWRAIALASYACDLVADLAPSSAEAEEWHRFLCGFLEGSGGGAARLIELESAVLRLSGLMPDFSGINPSAEWVPFAIDRGKIGPGTRIYRLSPAAAAAILNPAAEKNIKILLDAVRFLGVFLLFHLEKPAEVRRTVVRMIADV